MLYRPVYDHVLARVDPERAHHLAAAGLARLGDRARLTRGLTQWAAQPELAVEALGRRFPSPLGVAAGLDKDATFHRGLGALGFGFVEIGTVTPRPQPGNPRPRIARALADRALVNAMGFPSQGAEAVAARLGARAASSASGGGPSGDPRSPGGPILGINVGKNRATPLPRAAEDYATVVARLAPLADYLVLNVSSPNTPGLRALEQVEGLAPIIAAVRPHLGGVPLLVKISPDLALEDVDAVADLAVSEGLAGVIATNTTVDRGVLSGAGRGEVAGLRGGGVSGPPLADRSLAVLDRLVRRLAGQAPIVVSAGGVSSAEDVWSRLLAGATLVQVYTAFVYEGPAWPARVNRDLARRVRRSGAGSIADLIGVAGLSGPQVG